MRAQDEFQALFGKELRSMSILCFPISVKTQDVKKHLHNTHLRTKHVGFQTKPKVRAATLKRHKWAWGNNPYMFLIYITEYVMYIEYC